MNRIDQAIQTLSDALTAIPRDYPPALRKATYKKTLEGFAKFVLSEKAAEEARLVLEVKADIERVGEILERSRES